MEKGRKEGTKPGPRARVSRSDCSIVGCAGTPSRCSLGAAVSTWWARGWGGDKGLSSEVRGGSLPSVSPAPL